MPSSQRPPSLEPGRVRLRLAAACLGMAWTWGFWAKGAVSLGARSHLLTLCSLSLLLALWPGRGNQGHSRGHWLPGLVGVGLFGGALWAPVIQLPTWILALLGWTTWQVERCVLNDHRLRRALPSGLLVVCLVQALIGLMQAFQGEVVRGTLGNPNHFAGAMALAGGLVAGWLLRGAWWRDADALRWSGWAGRSAALAACALILTVVVLGQSRGGLAVLLAIWALAYLRWRGAGRGAIEIGGTKALGLVLWGGVTFAVTWWTVPRLSIDGLERRLQVYAGTLQLIVDHPWGVGPGLYRWLFRPYQRLESNKFFDYAHNDYLQLVAEWGWLAGGLLLAWLAVRLLGAWHLADSRGAAPLAVLSAVAAPLLHAWIDFDLHIPVLLMAVAALLAWTATGRGEPEPSSRDGRPGSVQWRWLLWGGLATLATLVSWRVQVVAQVYSGALGSDDPAVYARALERAPDAPRLHFGLALLYRDTTEHRDPKRAYDHLKEAIRLNPHSWRYRFELGRFYEQMGRDAAAIEAYGEALRRNPWEADDQRRIAGFYLRQGSPQGKALGRALLAQSAAEDRRLLRAGGELLLASGHGPQELVAWWPRDGTSQPGLLAVLCGNAAGRPVEAVDWTLLERVWRRWLDAADGEVTLEAGDVYPELLWQQGRGVEARQRWLELLEAEGAVDGTAVEAYRQRRTELWNGDFEMPMRRSALSWRVPVGKNFAVSRAAGEGLDGSAALLIDFDGTPKLHFKRLRQQLVLEPGAAYELVYHLRSEELGPVSGLGLQVLHVPSRKLLWRGEPVAGTSPWQSLSGRFEVPPGDGRVVVRLALGPGADDALTLDGKLWIDGLVLRRLAPLSPP